MDYLNVFKEQPFEDNSTSLAINPTVPKSGGIGALLSNPLLQTAALQLASALDPNGFGGRLAKGAMQMRQGMSMGQAGNQAVSAAQATQPTVPTQVSQLPAMPGQTTALPPATPPVQQPAVLSDNHVESPSNPLEVAKHYNTMGSLLKKSFEIPPSLVPSGYTEQVGKALATPPTAINPTQPVGNVIAGQPTGNVVQPAPTTSFNLSPELAGSMTPDQVATAFKTLGDQQNINIANRAQNVSEQSLPTDLAYKQSTTQHNIWQMDPQRHQEALEIQGEQSRAMAKMYEQKAVFDQKQAADFIAANPKTAGIRIPGTGMNMGQVITMSALAGDSGKVTAGVINSGLDYAASMARNTTELEATRLRMTEQGHQNDFVKKLTLIERYNADVAKYGKGVDATRWDMMTENERLMAGMAGGFRRSPETDEALAYAIRMRDLLEKDFYPQGSATEVRVKEETVRKAAADVAQPKTSPVAGASFKADPTKLKQMMDIKQKQRAVHSIFNFDPKNPEGGMQQ
jgi:hypothetical protein